MKLSALRNASNKRINVLQIRGLKFEPGEVRRVPSALVSHPAIAKLVKSNILTVVERSPKGEPKGAPVVAPIVPPVAESETTDIQPSAEEVEEEPVSTVEETEEVTEDPEVIEDDSNTLRTLYIAAPGITEGNVDGILEAYPNVEKLKEATKSDLLRLKVSKNQCKRLLSWISEQ